MTQIFKPSRAGDGVRTRDPQLGKLMLYQLSYVRATRSLAPVSPFLSNRVHGFAAHVGDLEYGVGRR